MSYPLLRRLPLGALDRHVARASMQICHKLVMQQLYISRADALKQWLVVSNPAEEAVDLSGFSLASSGTSEVFRFPNKYVLLAGDEVTIWCSPGSLNLDVDNLLQPYLFWTRPDGSLRHEPFFSPGAQANDVLLLDPLLVEVASLRVAADGKKEFRVLHCKSVHPRTVRSAIDTRFCVGCLSPPEFEKRASQPSPESGKVRPPPPGGRDVYVFSRYWGVVSDKSLLEHFLAVFFVPLVEAFRALLVYLMLCVFQPASSSGMGPHLRPKVTALVLMMLACDVIARRLMLCIKSGLLVTIASFTSVVLDHLALVALYTSLARVYPALEPSFQGMLTFELGVACVNAAAVHMRFLEARRDWHPLFKQLSRWDHRSRGIVCVCGVGRQLLLHLLLLLPFSNQPSPAWKLVGYSLVPLFTVATGLDFLRAVATLLHMVKFPFVRAVQQWQYLQQHKEEDEEDDEVHEEKPPVVLTTPRTRRSMSLHPYLE
ncbi:hypothetical protein BBJ28_00004301 [Nothophytophthora sp. Chile5]|nr:hypothetical protein BBJ28_00004301 [Nothophytophthora sp. Chile5]